MGCRSVWRSRCGKWTVRGGFSPTGCMYIVTLTIRALASTCGAPTCWCALGHISATPGWRRVDLVLFEGRGSSFSQTWTYTCFPAPAFSGCLSPLSERCKCFPALVKTHRPVHAVYLFGNVTAVFP